MQYQRGTVGVAGSDGAVPPHAADDVLKSHTRQRGSISWHGGLEGDQVARTLVAKPAGTLEAAALSACKLVKSGLLSGGGLGAVAHVMLTHEPLTDSTVPFCHAAADTLAATQAGTLPHRHGLPASSSQYL